MKLSQRLLATHKGFWFKYLWKKKIQSKVIPVKLPDALTKSEVKPVNSVQEFFASPQANVWVPPNDPRFMFPPRPEDDPNWHAEEALTFTHHTKLWEGTKQFQCLTNTVVTNGLPTEIAGYREDYPDIDHFMQRCILQANLWDTAREKLPRRKKPDDISLMNYKAEFGIPQDRIVDIMLKSIALKGLQILSLHNNNLLVERRILENFLLRTDFGHGDESIHLSCHSNILVTSATALSNFFDPNEVAESRYSRIEDIFPIAPTVDLIRSNVYHKESSSGTSVQLPTLNHHTLLLSMDPEWSMDHRHASALLRSYGHCLEMAKIRGITDLHASPVSVQAIHTDGETFGFTCFQLNTLETNSNESDIVRNQAWVYSDRLYCKEVPRRAMLRGTKYHSYNGDVVHKIMGMLFRQ